MPAGRGKSAYSADSDHETYAEHETLHYDEMPVPFALSDEEARDDEHKGPAKHWDAEDASIEKSALIANE